MCTQMDHAELYDDCATTGLYFDTVDMDVEEDVTDTGLLAEVDDGDDAPDTGLLEDLVE